MTFTKQPQEQFSKKKFLTEHNRLSPAGLRITPELLTRFQQEERPLLQDANWTFKLRVPLISWLLLLPSKKETHPRKSTASAYKSYPYPEN